MALVEGAEKSETGSGWELLALLAVSASVAHALGSRRGRLMRSRLDRVATDWEREGAGATDLAMQAASRRFIRPLLAHLESEDG